MKGSTLISRACVELLACMFFHFVGSVAPTPVANSVALMVAVHFAAKMSGAHLNPAISLTFSLLGHTPPLEMLVYWVSQVAGSVFGALLVALLVPGCVVGGRPDDLAVAGCFVPRPGLDDARTFGWEAVATLTFITSVFSVVWYTQNKSGYGMTGPIMIGLSLLASAYAAGPWTGAALNPARALGSAIVFDCARSSVTALYVAGEMLAGLLAPIIIVPWYGIAERAWYIRALPDTVVVLLREYHDIELKTLDRRSQRS